MPNLTDLGNAQRLIGMFGDGVRYCAGQKSWYTWGNTHWVKDASGIVPGMTRQVIDGVYLEAQETEDRDYSNRLFRHALKSESRQSIESMLILAQTEPGVNVGIDQWDKGMEWAMNMKNGTLDLRTGELYVHKKGDLVTKLAPVRYDPDAYSALWEEFMCQVVPDADTREFLQKAVGYSLTADQREEVVFFLYGTGNNGKSTFINTILSIMGDYATQCNPNSLMLKRDQDRPRNDIARLHGMRFVAAAEAGANQQFDEEFIKRVTGDDRIVARFLHQEEFTFQSTWKIWLMANHRPKIVSQDYAMWRRVRMIPFTVRFRPEDSDPMVKFRLTKKDTEWPGVLNWMLEGLRKWHQERLIPPDAVEQATNSYRREMDVLGQFLDDCCTLHPMAKVKVGDLYARYLSYCRENRDEPLGKKVFGNQLSSRGDGSIYVGKQEGEWVWQGINLMEKVSLRPSAYVDD